MPGPGPIALNAAALGLSASARQLLEAAVGPDAKPAAGLVLQSRDLRSVDVAFSQAKEPALLVRSNCLVVSLRSVRALVMHDRVLLFSEPGADGMLLLLEYRIAAQEQVAVALAARSE